MSRTTHGIDADATDAPTGATESADATEPTGAGAATDAATDATDGTDVTAETAPPEGNWAPTRLSVALSLAVTAAVAAALLSRVAVPRPAAAGVLGAALLAGALRAGGWERFRPLATAVESLLLLPVGLSLLVAVGGAVLLQYREAFPVATPSAIPAPALSILATTGVVAGVTLAVLGALAATGDLLTGRTLRRAAGRALRLGTPPTAVAAVLGGLTLLSSPEIPPTVDLAVALRTVLDGLAGFLLSPEATQVPLGTLLGLLTVAAWTTDRLVSALPTAELAAPRTAPGREWAEATASSDGDSEDGGDEGESAAADESAATDRSGASGAPQAGDAAAVAAAVERVGDVLAPAAFLLASGTLAVWAIEALLGPSGLAERVGPEPAVLVYGVATSPALRGLLVGVAAVAAVVVVLAWLLRRSVRARAGDVLAAYVPYAVGLGVVPVAFAVHDPVLGRGIPLVAELLSGFGEPFARVATGAVAFYGGGVVLLGLLGGALLLAAGTIALLWVGIGFGIPSGAPAGPALAGTGLLSAAGFLGAGGGPTWLVALGVLGSVLVRDLGRYGTVLGREVGRGAPTGRAEVVHAVGTVPVGLVGVGLALGLARLVTGTPVTPGVPVQVPLFGALAGVVLLVLALR